MKYSFFGILFFALSFHCYSQKVLSVDFDKIKEQVKDKYSGYYYPRLIERFKNGDTTLSPEHYKHIYYGNVFTKTYDPYGTSGLQSDFLDLYGKEKFREAIPLGLKELANNAVNLKVLFKVMVCYHSLGMTDSAKNYARKYYSLLHVIYDSGEGTTINEAMVVIHVSDEYEILRDAKLSITGQSLIGTTDKMSLNQENQKADPKVEALYFNVEMPLTYLNKQLTGK